MMPEQQGLGRSRFSLPIVCQNVSDEDRDAILLRLNRILPSGWDLPIVVYGPNGSGAQYRVQVGESTAQDCGKSLAQVLDYLSDYWGDTVGRET